MGLGLKIGNSLKSRNLGQVSRISLVAGSDGTASGNFRNIANLRPRDFVIALVSRDTGQTIVKPGDKGYIQPSGGLWNDGRLLLPAPRAYRLAWTWVDAEGTWNTGAFTSGGRIWALGIRGVGGVRQVVADAQSGSTSLAFPALAALDSARSFVLGYTGRLLSSAAIPAGATATLATNAGSTTVTSGVLWTAPEGQAHAPAALTQTAADWASIALELVPYRLG